MLIHFDSENMVSICLQRYARRFPKSKARTCTAKRGPRNRYDDFEPEHCEKKREIRIHPRQHHGRKRNAKGILTPPTLTSGKPVSVSLTRTVRVYSRGLVEDQTTKIDASIVARGSKRTNRVRTIEILAAIIFFLFFQILRTRCSFANRGANVKTKPTLYSQGIVLHAADALSPASSFSSLADKNKSVVDEMMHPPQIR